MLLWQTNVPIYDCDYTWPKIYKKFKNFFIPKMKEQPWNSAQNETMHGIVYFTIEKRVWSEDNNIVRARMILKTLDLCPNSA
jgi:hypothetical protein